MLRSGRFEPDSAVDAWQPPDMTDYECADINASIDKGKVYGLPQMRPRNSSCVTARLDLFTFAGRFLAQRK